MSKNFSLYFEKLENVLTIIASVNRVFNANLLEPLIVCFVLTDRYFQNYKWSWYSTGKEKYYKTYLNIYL